MKIVAENHAAMLRRTPHPTSLERELLDAVAHDLRMVYAGAEADVPARLIAMASRLDARRLDR